MQIIPIADRKQLDILRGRNAAFGNLIFSFTEAYIEQLSGYLESKHAFQILAKEGTDFVGYLAAAETLWSNHLTIIEVFIAPAFQGKGVGTMLVERAIAFAKQEKLRGMVVQTERENIPAQKLYGRIGFRKFENPEWEGISYKLSL